MATVQQWFHTSILKPAGPQPVGLPALEDDSNEVEVILKINNRGTHVKVKWIGYDFPKTNGFGSLNCKTLLLK